MLTLLINVSTVMMLSEKLAMTLQVIGDNYTVCVSMLKTRRIATLGKKKRLLKVKLGNIPTHNS